jgi:3-methyl-2-oxobutanoate hydroxymethyltransferase
MQERQKVTVNTLHEMYQASQKISMITCYDFPNAVLVDRAGMDIVLVGDSVAMTVLGYPGTLPMTMDEMLVFAKAVTRGAKHPFVLGDMPYMSYQVSAGEAVRNAGRFMAEANTDGIKLEGGGVMVKVAKAIIDAGIPVMGHLGLTPQSMAMMGGFKVQGRSGEAAKRILDDALALEEVGCFAILLELVPARIAEYITQKLSIPTISIGSGAACSGQCLIYHDAIGMFEAFTPKHVKRYADVAKVTQDALNEYVADVKEKRFPGPEHIFRIPADELAAFRKLTDQS